MRTLLCLVIGCSAALASWADVAATTVILRQGEPLRGFLVSQDARGVTLRVPAANGQLQQRFIPAAQIESVLQPVSPEKLASLQPAQPKMYRDYAEELAGKAVDPEARQVSLRLYLIAAWLDPKSLGKSSLLGMTALARSETEQRRFRAMAYLLDPDHDRSLLKSTAAARSDAAGKAEAASERLLLRALEELRKGRPAEARKLLQRSGVEAAAEPHADLISWDELQALSADRSARASPTSPAIARRLLTLELRLLGAAPAAQPARTAESTPGWSQLDADALAERTARLSLETLTEFSPADCLYRDGKWIPQ